MASVSRKRKEERSRRSPDVPGRPGRQLTSLRRERVLVEFPKSLLMRADAAARDMEKNRSDLIRTAVEQLLDQLESAEFNRELAEAYSANSAINLALAAEFADVDRDGF